MFPLRRKHIVNLIFLCDKGWQCLLAIEKLNVSVQLEFIREEKYCAWMKSIWMLYYC